MAHVVVLGAGAMGLAAAWQALSRGHQVTLLEAAPEAGGMAAHFDLAGLSIERFYHFVCKADAATFALMQELGIGDKMRWRPTSMGYFFAGKLYPWGDPLSLLRFPHLTPLEKLRYGMLMFVSAKRNRWDALEHVSAKQWIERWCGQSVYRKLWAPLFNLKFYQYADNISASWIWTRIRRVGRSRRSLMQEEMGYIEGGSQTLVDALMQQIAAAGGTVRLGLKASKIEVADGRVVAVQAGAVQAGAERIPCDAVICTVPTPLVSALVPDLPAEQRASYDAILNIGVVCVVVKLKRSVTPHFWVNIVDPDIPVPGIIEFSRLRQPATGETVVYTPYYMPTGNTLWARPDAVFIAEVMATLRRINPMLTDDDLIAAHVGRLRHAQPVCPPGFLARMPPVQTAIAGLQIADTSAYYPEDRGIAESIRIGRAMADRAGSATAMGRV
jgi:protoporphyrinogen oxidase